MVYQPNGYASKFWHYILLFNYFVSDMSRFFRLKCAGRRTASIAAGARLLGRLVGRSIVEDGVNIGSNLSNLMVFKFGFCLSTDIS